MVSMIVQQSKIIRTLTDFFPSNLMLDFRVRARRSHLRHRTGNNRPRRVYSGKQQSIGADIGSFKVPIVRVQVAVVRVICANVRGSVAVVFSSSLLQMNRQGRVEFDETAVATRVLR